MRGCVEPPVCGAGYHRAGCKGKSQQREIKIKITTLGHWLAPLARECRCSREMSDGLVATIAVRRVLVRHAGR
jgi:hypothetical protein